ncbi:hypothetical protein ACQYYE_05305 [Pseudomonas aeruginosa]|uniref:hypothetical protein n=1 Tax=Pseudomonas aeruginosa TaxID=287 RepID=UPI003D2DCD26
MTASKIQMDQIRSTSATDTGENIRAGSQKKSSLSQASGLHGASPDATCTCPSGDGSLVHPCPAHPASVEQAGGDERTAFEAWMTWLMDHVYGRLPDFTLDDGSGAHYVNADVSYAWTAWQARAALAQPSPVSEALIYACKNLAQITSSDGSGHADIAMAVLRMAGVGDDERERLVNEWKAARAWKPAPAQAEKAEVERPDVVARVVHSNPVVLDHCGPLNANDELMTVAQHAASVARWAEMFNRVEQERDAALARVAEHEAKLAELERQEPSGWLAYYFGGKRNGRIYGSPCNTKEEIDRYIQQVERSDDSITLIGKPFYAAPVAQAQHSVPEGWKLVPMDPTSQMTFVGQSLRYDAVNSIGEIYRQMLAAAPDKDGL